MASPPLIFDPDWLPPQQMTAPRIIGGAVEGGTSLSGISLASDIAGGGLIAVDYEGIQLNSLARDKIISFNRFTVALQGGVRNCVVSLMTDIYAPYSDELYPIGPPTALIASTFSDGAVFSDGSTFGQPSVSGLIVADANVGDATLTLTVINGRQLQGGEWFGVQHATKSFRAYCVTDVDTQAVDSNGVVTALVGIRPPLRDVLAIGQNVDWWRPRCLMRIKTGNDPSMMLQDYWRGSGALSFVEAF